MVEERNNLRQDLNIEESFCVEELLGDHYENQLDIDKLLLWVVIDLISDYHLKYFDVCSGFGKLFLVFLQDSSLQIRLHNLAFFESFSVCVFSHIA